MNPLSTTLGRCRIVIKAPNSGRLTSCTSKSRAYAQLATATASTHTLPPPVRTPPSSSYNQSTAKSSKTLPAIHRMNPGTPIQRPDHRPQARRYSPQHFYQNRILDPYVQQPVNPITLRQLVFFGRNMQEDKLLKSANYVRTELPVRLAHRIRDFQNLPFIVGTNPHIELVYDLYWQAFEKLSKVPEIKTLEENDRFCEMVKALLNDHLVVIPQLALGIMECSKHIPAQQVDQFMNKMLRSRISRRVLAEQHISLTSNYNSPNHMMTDRGFIGIIYTHCKPRDIIERTARLASETCRQSLGGKIQPPKVIMDGNLDAEFSYIPDHIEYILYELLKNSMRYVMLNGKRSEAGELPPIQITVCEGTHDIVFRVSDKGGGIAPEMESHLWSYSQSPARFANFEKVSKMAATVQEQMVSPTRSINFGEDLDDEDRIVLPPPPSRSTSSTSESSIRLDRHAPRTNNNNKASSSSSSNSYSTLSPSSPEDQAMHLGIGLPMSRVYAEYWGGDLKVFTMHGYGTDAYAKFCKFGNIYENFDV
ncbi:hypothetical protein CPB97_003221 [Podila verticillata]|nr:hypothetical protein CPB97_003221 [Podila verticillata]